MKLRRLTVPLAAVTATIAGCGGSEPATKEPPRITAQITDQGCAQDEYTSPTNGAVTFDVTNQASKKGEFEILSSQPSIVFEGFYAAGQSKTSTVMLRPGTYVVICGNTNTPNRARLVVGGKQKPVDAAQQSTALTEAAATYTTYVRSQARALEQGTTRFTDAVRAGNDARARSLYAAVREPWERIEPVAEAFPDADAAIDARADDHATGEADPAFIGFHALEYGLWAQGRMDGATVNLTRLANRLDRDVAALVGQVNTLTIAPATMVNGAAALIDEAAQTKVTGEEERYSHTDLSTLAANIEGSKYVLELIDAPLTAAAPQLRDDIRRAFTDVERILGKYELPNGYRSYEVVSAANRNALKTSMASLSELLAQVAGTLNLEITG